MLSARVLWRVGWKGSVRAVRFIWCRRNLSATEHDVPSWLTNRER